MSAWLYDVRQAFATAWRRPLFTVRAALGASRRGLLALVMRTEFVCVIAGIGAGLIVARMAASAMHSMLFAVADSEPGPCVSVSLLLAAVAAAACSVPAARAARTDPRDVMRE